jgi:predicted metal-binding protein
MEKLLADLEKYRRMALELGATDAKVIPAAMVTVDERVRLKCSFPRCHLYGETPNCPPYTPEPEFMRKALSKYSYAVLFKTDVLPKEDFVDDKKWYRGHEAHQNQTGQIVSQIESVAFNDGYYFALGFGAGGCKTSLCKGMYCQFLDSGRCRFPLRSRSSMEGVGIDVFRLVTEVGWEVYPVAHCNVDPDTIKCAVSVGIVFVW